MNKRKKLITIIVVVLIVIIAIGGCYFISRKNKSENLSVEKNKQEKVIKNTLDTNDKKDTVHKEDKKNSKDNTKDKTNGKQDKEKKDGNKDDSKNNVKKDSKSIDKNEKRTSKDKSNNSSKSVENDSFVSGLPAAKTSNQLIVVKSNGSSATVGLYTKKNGGWSKDFLTSGYVGYNGVGRKRGEGDGITPRGTYGLLFAFGINGNPGTSLEYRRVSSSDYWVDDPHSSHYNEWVNEDRTKKDWKSAEKLSKEKVAYKYAIAIDYNGGRGSAIFIHCNKRGATAGCVAMPQSYVIKLLKEVRPSCKIVIL